MGGYVCKWHKELELFYKLKPLLIMEGNILDLFRYPDSHMDLNMPQYLYQFLHDRDYENVVQYDSVNGFKPVIEGETDELHTFAKLTNAQTEIHNDAIQMPFTGGEENVCELLQKILSNEDTSSAVILNLASRYIVSANQLDQSQVDSFARLQLSTAAARDVFVQNNSGKSHYNKNLCILLVDKVNDLPVWFFKDNPYVKVLNISTPSKEEREEFVSEEGFREFFAPDIYEQEITAYEEHSQELKKIKDKFVALTEGFTRLELCDLSCLCENERYSIHNMPQIIDLYRYGVKENPWENESLRERLKQSKENLMQRVKGQPVAMQRTLQVIKRAVSGLSGLQHSSHGKPKGILFFAGPTGTGKTEMAKSLAELIFGEERCCIRFDMSEYSEPSSDQRLLGAAPGYIGYEAGGQLTNAVKEHPFSILLFDEIEKAHSSVMDKFLQILEDGRMTDGQGNTVYFSECVIIFTSNLGIYVKDEHTGRRQLQVTPEDGYDIVEKKVKDGIFHYFKVELGRPEILNRIGENIVVFDFIRPDTAKEIMDSQLDKIIRALKTENNVELMIEQPARAVLLEKVCGNLENGGRGVGNIIEELILNPLSEYMLDHDLLKNTNLVIHNLDTGDVPVKLEIEAV